MYRLFLTLTVLLSAPYLLLGQGMEFFTGSWEEALQKSRVEGKPIFVDAYAEWCGPCKRMAREVFPDERSGDYYNNHFINMQIDMEKGEGPELAKKFKVGAYPTLIFVSQDGEEFHRYVGACNVGTFIQVGAEAYSKFDVNASYRLSYEEGNRSYETVYGYMLSLRKNNESTIKIGNEYLKTSPHLTDQQRKEFVFAAASEADSKLFDEALSYKKDLLKEFGQAQYEEWMMQAVMNTVRKSIQFQYEPLMDDAVSKIKKFSKESSDKLSADARMYYYGTSKNNPAYLKAVEDYYQSTPDVELKERIILVRQMLRYFNNIETRDMAVDILNNSWSDSDNIDDLLNAAQFYVQCYEKEEAIAILEAMQSRELDMNQSKHYKVLKDKLDI